MSILEVGLVQPLFAATGKSQMLFGGSIPALRIRSRELSNMYVLAGT